MTTSHLENKMLKRKFLPNDDEKENRRPNGPIGVDLVVKKTKLDALSEITDNCLLTDATSPRKLFEKKEPSESSDDTEDAIMNALDQTTQLRSSLMSDDGVESPFHTKVRLFDTCLKLIKPTTQTKLVAGMANNLPHLMGLSCKKTGSILLPFGGTHADQVMSAYENSRMSSYTVVKAEEVSFRNPEWDEKLRQLVKGLLDLFDCKIPLKHKLEKLLLLKRGDRLERTCTGEKFGLSFGTLFIELASNYTGGEIITYERGSKTCYDKGIEFRSQERQNEFSIYYTAPRAEMDYEISEVESGHRLILVYSLECSVEELMSESGEPKKIETIANDCLEFFSRQSLPLAVMLRNDYDGELVGKHGFKVLDGIDLERVQLLKSINERLPDQPFEFFMCRAELVVEWYDRKGCPGDPMSNGNHDWDEKCRSSLIKTWHDENGSHVFSHLETNLNFFSVIVNPNSSSTRFWQKPDQCDEAWGEADESENEIIDDSLVRTVYYHRWLMAFWPRKHLFHILLERNIKEALDQLRSEKFTESNSEKIERFRNLINWLIDHPSSSQIDTSQDLELIFQGLVEIGDASLASKFMSKTSLIEHLVVGVNPDVLANLIAQFGFHGFIKPKHNYLKTIIQVGQKLLEMGQKRLAEEFLKSVAVPILENEQEMNRVLINNRSVSKIRVIGQEKPLEARRLRPGDSELIQLARLLARLIDERDDNEELMLAFTTTMRNCLEPSSLKILLEDVANDWNLFKNSKRIHELLNYRLEWIVDKCRKDSEFTWRMTQARLPEYPQVEAFLRSDEVRYVLIGVFSGVQQARRFATEYQGLKNGYSAKMIESGSGKSAQVEITKTSSYFESKKGNLKKYEMEKTRIEGLLYK